MGNSDVDDRINETKEMFFTLFLIVLNRNIVQKTAFKLKKLILKNKMDNEEFHHLRN